MVDPLASVLKVQGFAGASRGIAIATLRATVTEADGQREATIKVAEGNRQAAILSAQGFALALQEVFNIAKTVDNKAMSLQYLEALKALGGSPATKFVFPTEFSNLLRPFTRFTGGGDEGKE